jgi:hypothetical protein
VSKLAGTRLIDGMIDRFEFDFLPVFLIRKRLTEGGLSACLDSLVDFL